MIKEEFRRFLRTLTLTATTSDELKIANLVLNHIEDLIILSSGHGQRIRKLVDLCQKEWDSTITEIQPSVEQVYKRENSIVQLKELTVGPFRGFERKVKFDLASQLVLIYGPNGSGKSSFCEALEYCLLRNVAEAENKRFINQDNYLKNARTNSFTPPELYGLDNQEKNTAISANEALFRFCFVEKNRIDNFARIAAQIPSKQSELISSLFGLDKFTEFVRNFTPSMDERYIDLEGVKNKVLSKKQQELAGFNQQIQTIIPEEFIKIRKDEEKLAKDYQESLTFNQIVTELNGSEENAGSIKELEDFLQKPIGSKTNLTGSNLDRLKLSIETDIKSLNNKQDELTKASQQVSYKKLYEAVSELKESKLEYCPACQTPLTHVKVDPFLNAESEIKKLQQLDQIQQEVKKLTGNINESLYKVFDTIKTCCEQYPDDIVLSTIINIERSNISISWWSLLNKQEDGELTSLQYLRDKVLQLEKADEEFEKVIIERSKKQDELSRLREISNRIIGLQKRRENANSTMEKAKNEVKRFNQENSTLIKEAEIEKNVIKKNKNIASAYTSFVIKLNNYKDTLPYLLVEDLGERVVELYNAFNDNDAEHEKLSRVRLPLQQNQRLEVSFTNNPTTYFDALHILSEGHIRCLGLAILTAKNIKENSPFLIFDDPVNAIDDDHREAIRNTLFKNDLFDDKQIILTCHGEEFFKDIQNQFSRKKIKQSKTFTFLPKFDETNINIDFNCPPRNYIVAARENINQGQIRDALSKSRQALESITKNRLWKYYNNHGGDALSILLRNDKAAIELRNLTEQLNKKISCHTFSAPNKKDILEPLQSLLGIEHNSMEWRYLNKGTHEEANRAEFERGTVSKIISSLEQLDEALGS